MDATQTPTPSAIAADEKLTPVMFYTDHLVARGMAVTKEAIRVNIWLRTQSAPEFIHLKNCQVISFTGPGPVQPITFSDYFLPAGQVLAYHLLPPASDPLDYDETEKNRKMEPVMVLVGNFRFNAQMRMSTQLNVGGNLDVSRIAFLSVYNAEISNPYIPSMGVIKAPMVLVRVSQATFGVK